MPLQKRKLSTSDVTSLNTNIDNSRKQRYNASLLFKPNISSKPKNQLTSDDNLNRFNNLEISNPNNQLQTSEPPLPKLSIKRKVNRESNLSEFTVETKNSSPNEDRESSIDENEEDSYSNEEDEVEEEGMELTQDFKTSQNEETNDTSSSSDSDENNEESSNFDESSESESNGSEIDEENNLIETNVFLNESDEPIGSFEKKYSKLPLNQKSKKSSESTDDFDESLIDLKQDFAHPIKKDEGQKINRKIKLTQDNQESGGESQSVVKVKGKRGRKPGYRKYPEGYVKPQKQSAINKTPRTITSYFLFCQVNRPIIAEKNPELKLRAQQRIVSDMWNKLTDKERLIWRQKAIKLSKKGSKGMISTGGSVNQTPVRQAGKQSNKTTSNTIIHKTIPAETKIDNEITEKEKISEETVSLKVIPIPPNLANFNEDCKPIDLAAYLSILGESMSTFGNRLKMHEGKFAVQGASFVLLDAFLCALGPIFCLTTQIEEMNGCPKETIMKILDNISVLMPGS